MNKRILAVAGAAAIAVAGWATGGFGLLGNGDGEGLTLYGNVDVREVDMAFRVGGRIARIAVEEGDKVAVGQELAVIDAAPIDSRIAEADAAIAQARAQLERLRNGNWRQDIAQARARASAAEATFREAQQDADRRQPLVEPGAISRDAWAATLAQRDRARAQLDEAREALSRLAAGSRPEDIAAAQAQLQAAQALRASIGTDRADTVLVAAGSGTIITRAQEPGAIVQPGQNVVTISIDRPLRVRAYVAEGDLSRVAPGMKVEVTADGNARTYHGTIGFVSPRAEFTPKTVETEDLRTDLVYRLRITVDDPDGRLRQGQPVTVKLPAGTGRAGD